MRRPSTPPAPTSTVPSCSSSSSSYSTSTTSFSWRSLYLLCLCALLSLPQCAAQCDPCTPGGCGGLDLRNYTREHRVGSSTGTTYLFQMCAVDSSCDPGQLCKSTSSWGGPYYSLGGSPQWTLRNPNDASQGATLTLSGGSDGSGSGCDQSANSSIAVICGTNDDGFNLNTEGSSGNCQWTFTFNAVDVCRIPPGTGGSGGGSSSSSSGLSGGSIFLILFFVGGFVYFAGGVLFNKYRRGLSGAELIPNVGFWRDLPGLVKDGCVFSFNKVRALVGGARTGSLASKGTGSTYETI